MIAGLPDKEYFARHYQKNKGRIRLRQREYSLKNRERLRKTSQAWADNNRDKVRAIHAKFKAANPDAERDYSKKWRAKNPEKRRAVTKRYYHNNKALCFYNSAKRRYKVRVVSIPIEKGAIMELMKKCKADPLIQCVYCGLAIPAGQRELEHVIPICRGGHHVIANLAIACKRCNRSKGTRLLFEWTQRPIFYDQSTLNPS